ncbi:glycosyltransferase family 4 protein [Sphingobacterium sp. lm-10]|uniref:glycosyltransferase family 4 protein n=1 Tax=Sphingobacterium sp. lm-10 TaxID=2944904 RepID=UPI00201FDB3D|nr:glycosyltransferase family 1 protein [Sphingobacterium sp. lm-10]MCL7988651.1 glycosyltransferase family 4 protein [Sphingobacterium sp. lm-10]
MKICVIYRNINVGFSIHKVISTTIEKLKCRLSIEEIFLPSPYANILSMFRNGFFARNKKATVYHISGDVHYLSYFLLGRTTIVTVHDIMYFSYLSGIKKMIWKRLYIDSLSYCKHVVFVSDYAKAQVVEYLDLPEQKISIIPNPVSPLFNYQEKTFNSEKPTILHIGTLKRKNLQRTIEAISTLSCHLRIVGKLDTETISQLTAKGIDYSNVVGLSDIEIVNEYQNADIINFPSLFEGFGMPIIEGQKVGRVVLTSNRSPMKEVAGNQAAFLVDPENVDSIRQGYKAIIEDSLLRESLIAEGQKNSARYDAEKIAEMYSNLYKSIIK